MGVISWWYLLCAIGAVNVLAWSLCGAALKRRQLSLSLEAYTACRLQLLLSAVYVFGCAFRSALPVYDIPRICLFNSWVSSVIVGRSVATLAELSFVAQWALLLRGTARATGSVVARWVSIAIVPLIGIAEICSWYSVLTTSNLGHVAEESIWGVSAALLVVSMAAMRPRTRGSYRALLVTGCVAGSAYIGFMFLVDVPMYWSRWMAQRAAGHQYLSIAQGLFDAAHRRIVSYRWQDWRSEVAWMTLYFSVAVWISIALVYASAQRSPAKRDPGAGQLPG